MSKSKKQLEREAEKIEEQAEEEIKNKNYDLAILLLKDAKDIYLQLGFKGQIGILKKKIERFQKLQSLENERNKEPQDNKRQIEKQADKFLEKAKNARTNQKIGAAIMNYEEALNLYEKLNFDYQCKKIKWEINKLKNEGLDKQSASPVQSGSDLSIAEKRRQRIQKQQEKEKRRKEKLQDSYSEAKEQRERIREKVRRAQKEEQEEQRYLKKLKQREKEQKLKEKKIQEKMRKQKEKEREHEKLINEANSFLDSAKYAVDNNQFSEAKENYRDAIKIFKRLKWFDQVDVLYKEIKNLETYKLNYEKKQRKRDKRRKEKEKEFEARVQKIKKEKEKRQNQRKKQLEDLSPVLKRKMDKISMLIKKGEKEAKIGKTQRALKRYHYCLELYESIPEDQIDLSRDITQIKGKIEDLEQKK
ncbi:MAG: hypothetical protein ACOC44_16045 [Promethearchaeia archaeon]